MSLALHEMSTEQLAEHRWLTEATGGLKYARIQQTKSKESARAQILSLFSRRAWPRSLSIMTMPGLKWIFERQLLSGREGQRAFEDKWPRRTFICAIEEDEAIYRGSMKWMPGSHALCRCDSPPGATSSYRTQQVVRYHRMALEDYVDSSEHEIDAAWIDLHGCVTVQQLAAIERLYRTRIINTLVVTATFGRSFTSRPETILSFPGNIPLHAFTYNDTSPMFQVAIRKPDASKGRGRIS